ncbi:MAG: hypothetical protein R3F36_07275 [Candidatus Competibacteraceae bacterium]
MAPIRMTANTPQNSTAGPMTGPLAHNNQRSRGRCRLRPPLTLGLPKSTSGVV